MGGFLAALGGAGEAAGQYGQQMRQLHQQTKMEMARQLGEQLARLDPQSAEYRDVVGHLNTTLGAQPGDPGNVGKFQKIAQFLHIHPDNTKGLQDLYSANNQPQTTKPAPPSPAGPGQIPGVPGQIQIPPHEQEPMDIPSGFLAAMGAVPSLNGQGAPPMQQPQPSAPPAAQPALNPIEPKAQARMQGPPVAAAGAAAPSWSSPPVGVSAIPPVNASAAAGGPAIPQYITDLLHSPVMAKQNEGRQLMQPYLTNDAEMQKNRQTVDFRLGALNDPRVKEYSDALRKQGYPEYAIPSAVGSLIGAPVPAIPGMANLAMTPLRIPGSAAGIRSQYPELGHLVNGLADNAPVTLLYNRMNPEQSTVMQGSETTREMMGDQGPVAVGSRSGAPLGGNPQAGLNLPSLSRPMRIGVNSSGQEEFALPSSLLHPEQGHAPLIGGYAPGAMGTSSTMSMDASGNTHTVRQRTPPAGSGGGATAIPPVSGGASAGGNAPTTPNRPLDTTDAKVRQSTERAFASGKEAQIVRSNNTALEHLSMLDDAFQKMKGGDIPAANNIVNTVGKALGLSGKTTFDAIAQRVGQEINSSYVAGGGGELERLEGSAHFGSGMSPEQFHNNLITTIRLMSSLQDNLQEQYKQGTSGYGKRQILTPTSVAIKQKYLGRTLAISPVAGDAAKRLIDKYK